MLTGSWSDPLAVSTGGSPQIDALAAMVNADNTCTCVLFDFVWNGSASVSTLGTAVFGPGNPPSLLSYAPSLVTGLDVGIPDAKYSDYFQMGSNLLAAFAGGSDTLLALVAPSGEILDFATVLLLEAQFSKIDDETIIVFSDNAIYTISVGLTIGSPVMVESDVAASFSAAYPWALTYSETANSGMLASYEYDFGWTVKLYPYTYNGSSIVPSGGSSGTVEAAYDDWPEYMRQSPLADGPVFPVAGISPVLYRYDASGNLVGSFPAGTLNLSPQWRPINENDLIILSVEGGDLGAGGNIFGVSEAFSGSSGLIEATGELGLSYAAASNSLIAWAVSLNGLYTLEARCLGGLIPNLSGAITEKRRKFWSPRPAW